MNDAGQKDAGEEGTRGVGVGLLITLTPVGSVTCGVFSLHPWVKGDNEQVVPTC